MAKYFARDFHWTHLILPAIFLFSALALFGYAGGDVVGRAATAYGTTGLVLAVLAAAVAIFGTDSFAGWVDKRVCSVLIYIAAAIWCVSQMRSVNSGSELPTAAATGYSFWILSLIHI